MVHSAFLTRVRQALAEYGARPAFVTADGTVTRYADAHRTLTHWTRTLATAGLGTGDTVAIAGSHRPGTLLLQLAAQWCGASVLLVPDSATPGARAAALDAADVDIVLADAADVDIVLAEDESPGFVGARRVLTLPPPDRTADGERDEPIPPPPPPAVHTVFGSGGTTGTPKLISHRGIYEGMAHIFTPDPAGPQRILVVAALSHLSGHCAALGALLCGDTVFLHPPDRTSTSFGAATDTRAEDAVDTRADHAFDTRADHAFDTRAERAFDAGAALRAIERHRITHVSLTPPRLAALLDHPALATTDVSSLRRVSLGAAPLPRARLRQALDVFGPVVGQGYGLTEAPVVASIDAHDYRGHPRRLGSVGRIVPGMEARIADDGEVLVRGLALMEGYHRAPEATDRALSDGWLHTGDLGEFDADGYLYLHGRADDVVVTGEHGTKVHPAVVEDALAAHPAVRQAAVTGIPGADGDVLHAVVLATGDLATGDLTADQLRDHVRTQLGGEHFVPRSVTFAAALPLTPVGKVDRAAVRAAVAT